MTGATDHKLFCFGYGYSCDYLGFALQQLGNWAVAGTTRDPDKRAFMKERGIQAVLFDYEQHVEDIDVIIGGATHLLISTPPDDGGDPVFRMYGREIANLKTLQWVGYLSSTGVYGDRGGEWVDETMAPQPTNKRGTRRARAEEQWLSLYQDYNVPVHIFRLAGIYGPGRSALDSVRAGMARRIDKPGHVFSRIHVDDIVQVLMASMARPAPGGSYNVWDDESAPSHAVIAYACELLGIDAPPLMPFDEVDMAPIARSFYSDNKRVRNELIKDKLGVQLRHPDFKTGLRACLEAEKLASQMLEHDRAGGVSGTSG